MFFIEGGGRNERSRDFQDPAGESHLGAGTLPRLSQGQLWLCLNSQAPRDSHFCLAQLHFRTPRYVLGLLILSLTHSINKHNTSPSLVPELTCV